MKRRIRFIIVCLSSILFITFTSCGSIQPVSHDQGNHNGWYKNPNNPHNPDTVKTEKQTGNSKKTKIK